MMTALPYSFRRATEDDIPLLQRWRAAPQVARWWEDSDPTHEDLLEDLDETDTRIWIVSIGERPFAYLQDYDPYAWPGHHFSFLPPGSRGIDQYIGEPDLLDQGHGSAFIRAHVVRLFAEGAPAVGVDPSPDNLRAIRCYEKAGFTAGEVKKTDWGRSLLMVSRAKAER